MNDNETRTDEYAVDPAMAARWLGVERQTLSNWRHKGIGPAYARMGRKIAYFPSDLRRFIAERTVTPVKE